MLTIVRVCKL